TRRAPKSLSPAGACRIVAGPQPAGPASALLKRSCLTRAAQTRADSSSGGSHGPRKGRVLDPDHPGGPGRASVPYQDNPPARRSPVTKAEKHLRKVEVAFPGSAAELTRRQEERLAVEEKLQASREL